VQAVLRKNNCKYWVFNTSRLNTNANVNKLSVKLREGFDNLLAKVDVLAERVVPSFNLNLMCG
jgi:hypothetical protein